MAINSRPVNVGVAATPLDTAAKTDDQSGSAIAVYNNGSATVFLGPAAVTVATGFPLAAGSSMTWPLQAGDRLYGIVASGTVEVRVGEAGI